MARHMSEQKKGQTRPGVLRESPRSALCQALPASLLRTVTGGDSGDDTLAPTPTPQPPPDTKG